MGALDDGTTVKLPTQHTNPNHSDRLFAGRHPLCSLDVRLT